MSIDQPQPGPYQPGVFRIVQLRELEGFTSEGWELWELVPTTQPLRLVDPGGYYPDNVPGSPQLVSTYVALIRLDPAGALTRMHQEFVRVRAEGNDARKRVIAAESELKKVCDARDALSDRLDALVQDVIAARAASAASETARRTLERDLAKVRKHFGEKAFAEAVNEE